MSSAETLFPPVASSHLHHAEKQQATDIVHAELVGLLPKGYRLAIHRQVGTVTVFTCEQDAESGSPQARLLAQQSLTPSELSLVLPIIRAYPAYCPTEVLLASFVCGPWHDLSTEEVASARKRLQQAAQQHRLDQELKPVRNVLSRARLKLQDMGLTITSILETGYQLMPRRAGRIPAQQSAPGRTQANTQGEGDGRDDD